jgi:hypothetical protein
VSRLRKRGRVGKQRVVIGAADPALTPNAGLVAVSELDDRLGISSALDAGIGAVKQRNRGLTGAGVVMALASCHLAGGDHLVSLDRLRADTAGQELLRAPTPASTTAAGIAARFTDDRVAGIETGEVPERFRTGTQSKIWVTERSVGGAEEVARSYAGVPGGRSSRGSGKVAAGGGRRA